MTQVRSCSVYQGTSGSLKTRLCRPQQSSYSRYHYIRAWYSSRYKGLIDWNIDYTSLYSDSTGKAELHYIISFLKFPNNGAKFSAIKVQPEWCAKQEQNHHLQITITESPKRCFREASALHQLIEYLLTKIPGQQGEIRVATHVLQSSP